MGLPVSTTYVCFAAVVATGWGDKIFSRGSSDLKLGRAIWVVVSWILGAIIASVAAACISLMVFRLGYLGLVMAFAINLFLRAYFKQRSDSHEVTYHHKKSKKGLV